MSEFNERFIKLANTALDATTPHATDYLGFSPFASPLALWDVIDDSTRAFVHDQALPQNPRRIWEFAMRALANTEEYY
jgi:hypothetical protein